jgi:glycosyltransferase involved in cell wall biosynthesis
MRLIVPELGDKIAILATPGPQSQQEIEGALGAPIHIAPEVSDLRWRQLGLEVPQLFFHTGWAYPNFRSLAREVKKGGGAVVCMVDNSRKKNLRQFVGKFVFRWIYRPHIDFVLVPGASGQELMRFFGMSDISVFTGMYGADRETFQPGPPLNERQYDFLFAGQFIPRKGVLGLIRAVQKLRSEGKPVRIMAIGAGPLGPDLESAGIEIHPFADATVVAQLMRQARFLVLPSLEDHWGLVVHEATLCGCGLVLSRAVGAISDLLSLKNGFVCEPGQPEVAMRQALLADSSWLSDCPPESLRLASSFGPDRWRSVFWSICARAGGVLSTDEDPFRTCPTNI